MYPIRYKGSDLNVGDLIPVDIYKNGVWNEETRTHEDVLIATDVLVWIAPVSSMGSTDHVQYLGRTWNLHREGKDHFSIVI